MKPVFAVYLALILLCNGCMVAQTTVGVRSGGSGISLSSYGDFFTSSSGGVYSYNREGLSQLLDNQYKAAETTFRQALEKYPSNPDSVYYLGLTLIYEEKRDEGYELLSTYRDPHRFRVTSEVQRMAAYLSKKPELTPKKIHEVMNKTRVDAFNRHYRERNDIRRSGWGL